MREEILQTLPAAEFGIEDFGGDAAEEITGDAARRATTIKVKPVYEITRSGCQCLGFMQYKLDGFDAASYMDMLSDPATMQAIKEVYYKKPIETHEETPLVDRPELQLEY